MTTNHIELTDSEVAVLIDSLSFMSEHLFQRGHPAANVNSALAKINSLMLPSTYGLRVEAL